jgi:hypothetical protein
MCTAASIEYVANTELARAMCTATSSALNAVRTTAPPIPIWTSRSASPKTASFLFTPPALIEGIVTAITAKSTTIAKALCVNSRSTSSSPGNGQRGHSGHASPAPLAET